MKKFIFVCLIALIGINSNAQRPASQKKTNTTQQAKKPSGGFKSAAEMWKYLEGKTFKDKDGSMSVEFVEGSFMIFCDGDWMDPDMTMEFSRLKNGKAEFTFSYLNALVVLNKATNTMEVQPRFGDKIVLKYQK